MWTYKTIQKKYLHFPWDSYPLPREWYIHFVEWKSNSIEARLSVTDEEAAAVVVDDVDGELVIPVRLGKMSADALVAEGSIVMNS